MNNTTTSQAAQSPRRGNVTPRRAGATTIESAVVLAVFVLVVFVILSLGLSTFRYNALGAAARRVAREAIVHGARAAPEHLIWGPVTYASNAAAGSEIASTVAEILPTMSPADVNIQVSWPDGNNRENDRVRVRLTYVDTPVLPFMSLQGSLTLTADCTMRIVH
jgi:hypothetical protein